MSSKPTLKRLSKEARTFIRASPKPVAELAKEFEVSAPTIRRWKSSADVEDRSSRPQRLQTSLTAEQERGILDLWMTRPRPLDQLLIEVRLHVAPNCSRSALYRCMKRNGIGDYGAAKNVPKREGSPVHCSSSSKGLAAYAISGVTPAVSARASNYITLSPSATGTRVISNRPSTQNVQSGLPASCPAPCMSENTVDIPAASSTPPVYPASTLKKSIDFVVLNHIGPEYTETIFTLLSGNGFNLKYDSLVLVEGWSFERQRLYHVGDGSEIIVYYNPMTRFNPTLWMMVKKPTRSILILLDAFFDELGLSPRIRKLELSFDFHTQDPGLMKDFIVSHLYLRHQRSKSKVFKSTFYSNDLRGSANGLRCYIKARKSEYTFTRFELHLAKGPVRQLGIKWLVNDLETFKLDKHIAFMEMDGERAVRTLVGRTAPLSNPAPTLREKLRSQMWQRAAESWVRMETPEHVGLMKQVEQMKDRETGMSKPERYFRLIPFNSVFFNAVSKLKFLF